MKPIEPDRVIDNGIAIYIPYSARIGLAYIRIEILFNKTNPSLPLAPCNSRESKVMDRSIMQAQPGSLILYETNGDIPIGFYTIRITVPSQGRAGEKSISIIRPTKRLVIGLPYSIYPPIEIS